MRWHPPILNTLSPLLEWNPQLFREVKGRLTQRNVILTLISSLLIQWLFLRARLTLLPGTQLQRSGNHYCTGPELDGLGVATCLKDSAGSFVINWQLWWFDIYRLLSWSLPVALLLAGTYLLLEDLGRELRRGTLNFIRTSPQSSDRILLGKVLGVPVIPYLAIALTLPLHGWAASQGQIPLNQVVGLYLFTLAASAFVYVGSLLLAFMGGGQGWIGLMTVGLSFCLFFSSWRSSGSSTGASFLGVNSWYGLSIGHQLNLAVAFAVATLGMSTFWLWQAVNRRYRNPQATLWSKTQSYWLTVGFELWLLGFYLPGIQSGSDNWLPLLRISLVNLLWFTGLIMALTPQRQALLDWARYRHVARKPQQNRWQRSWLNDLLTYEKSPALLAIGLNLVLAFTLVGIWLLVTQSPNPNQVAIVAGLLLLGVVRFLVIAAIVQLILLSTLPRRTVLAAASLIGLVILPPMVLAMLGIFPYVMPLPWLFTFTNLTNLKQVSALTLGFGFVLQLGVLSALTLHLTRQLRQVGASQSKALLSGSQRQAF